MVMGAHEFPTLLDEIRRFGGRARRVFRVPTRPSPLVHSFAAAVRSKMMLRGGEGVVEGARGDLRMSEWAIVAMEKTPARGGPVKSSVMNPSSENELSEKEIATTSMVAGSTEEGMITV
jgi:hypothetical protein